jgi:hypothetical protein
MDEISSTKQIPWRTLSTAIEVFVCPHVSILHWLRPNRILCGNCVSVQMKMSGPLRWSDLSKFSPFLQQHGQNHLYHADAVKGSLI